MKNALKILTVFGLWIGVANEAGAQERNQTPMETKKIGLVVHGGAGTIDRNKLTPEKEKAYHAALKRSLQAGYEILARGGSSLDAVEASVIVLEDDPLFNAGKGAVFTSAGTNELDASIMIGKDLRAGGVAAVRRIKNPISLARMVMERTKHVLLIGDGAEALARENGVELVDPKYFHTEERWEALQREKEAQKKGADAGTRNIVSDHDGHGTVGAVALDAGGNLAAATSTGGTTNKRVGRVGDSPIIGAGTYANNATCAVSATGDGEYFIRAGAARDVSVLMEHTGKAVAEAGQIVIEKIAQLGGKGGLIAVDKGGNIAMPFSTEGMYRGWVDASGNMSVAIHRETPD